MSLILRPYQEFAITDAANSFRAYRRVLLVAPTGSGKTVIFCEVVRRALLLGNHLIIIAHRIEIVLQIHRALEKIGVDASIVAPGHEFRIAPVMVAMVQSLARRIRNIPAPNLVIFDEAHHATATSYKAITKAWPDARVFGVTATPQRTDGAGLGDCFDVIVLGPPMRQLIADRYLSNYRFLAPPKVADFSSVKTRAGDYSLDQLAAAMDQHAITGDAEGHYRQHLAGKPAIAFCASVAHAEHVAEQFRDAGWDAASVDGAMAPNERAARIAAIGNGGLNILTSCDVISEGTDIPTVFGAILLRPTQSVIVYLQQVGRVMRPKPDGGSAVILDHVGNVFAHGMPDADREWTLDGAKKTNKSPSIRQCGICYAVFPPAPVCPNCGEIFAGKPRKSIAVNGGSLSEITAEELKQTIMRDTKPLISEAWRSSNAGTARELFRQVAMMRGYKAGWTFMQMQRWQDGKNNRSNPT